MAARQIPVAEFKARCLRIIKEMNRDGGSVTITNRGRPVAVLSPVPALGEKLPPFTGMMRGTVLRYEDPFEPAAPPSDWSALRWSCSIRRCWTGAAEGNRRLGETARATIEETRRRDRVEVSAISPWEIALLVERDRLQLAMELGAWIQTVLQAPGVDLLPIEPKIAIDSVRLPGRFHADPADRLIIATARRWGTPLLTADHAILAYAAEGHVQVVDALR